MTLRRNMIHSKQIEEQRKKIHSTVISHVLKMLPSHFQSEMLNYSNIVWSPKRII